jgi:hypothetical protein
VDGTADKRACRNQPLGLHRIKASFAMRMERNSRAIKTALSRSAGKTVAAIRQVTKRDAEHDPQKAGTGAARQRKVLRADHAQTEETIMVQFELHHDRVIGSINRVRAARRQTASGRNVAHLSLT